MAYPGLIEQLIEHLSKLPGVGRRSAERMVFWFLNNTKEDAQAMARSIVNLKQGMRVCRQCNHLSEAELCAICDRADRDKTVICVVENPKDVLAIEKSGSFTGVYHVLLGSISPAEGRGPDDIKVQHLLNRIGLMQVKEIIIATDADNEGEMTALYLIKQLKPLNIKISRIGVGIPVGSSIEFADMSTLGMSLTTRREVAK